ncbi:MAG TPA: MopE-related protein [Myxococcota bacterium]|nr:MopE-related protein [Myxococcota bacterium]
MWLLACITSPRDYQAMREAVLDRDRDGYGDPLQPVVTCPVPEEAVQDASDCDDSRGDINPGMVEVCNQTDDDCDGEEDEDVDQTWYRDQDEDGYGDDEVTVFGCEQPSGYVEVGGDCDDGDTTRSPGEPEVCDDFVDNDCDGGDNGCSWVGDVGVEEAGFFLAAGTGESAGSVLDGGVPIEGGEAGVLVGAPGWNANTGRVYVGIEGYYNADVDLSEGPVYMGSSEYDYFGSAVAIGADRDRDDDVEPIVGARGAGETNEGCVYAFDAIDPGTYGPDDGVLAACGLDAHGYFGTALALSGFSGGFWSGAPGSSAVYRFPESLEGEVDTGAADRKVTGSGDDEFGQSVTLLDMDGDGVDALAVGAPAEDAVYLFRDVSYGQTVSKSDADRRFFALSQIGFGDDVSGGDLNGDGYDDLVVSVDDVQVSVFFGPDVGDLPDSTANVRATGSSGDRFGASASIAADVDLDRQTDLAIGAPAFESSGAVFLFHGPVSGAIGPDDAGAALIGEFEAQHLGEALVSGGEDVVHLDIVDSLFIGAPGTGSLIGGAYRVSGEGL